jgi:hypothetical protein
MYFHAIQIAIEAEAKKGGGGYSGNYMIAVVR